MCGHRIKRLEEEKWDSNWKEARKKFRDEIVLEQMAIARSYDWPACLEDIEWQRIVFDEFHELEGFKGEQLVALFAFDREHSFIWGLTGTPHVDSCASIDFMAALFGIDLLGVTGGYGGTGE